MASKEVDGSDPLNSIAMWNCYVEIVISTIRLYSLPLFFHRIYREPLYGTMLGPRAAERGSGTWADGGHRRQLGQESGRSRAAARGSPKSPTPPSSPHLAVPPPALLHAPTPLPRYPGTLNDVILPLQGGSGRASRLSIRKPFLGGPGATTPFTEGGRQVPSMDLTQLFKITEGSTHVPVLPCQETKQKVNWGQSVRDPRTDAERAQRPRRRDARARAARPSSPRPAFVLCTRFRLSYHTHCLPTAP